MNQLVLQRMELAKKEEKISQVRGLMASPAVLLGSQQFGNDVSIFGRLGGAVEFCRELLVWSNSESRQDRGEQIGDLVGVSRNSLAIGF